MKPNFFFVYQVSPTSGNEWKTVRRHSLKFPRTVGVSVAGFLVRKRYVQKYSTWRKYQICREFTKVWQTFPCFGKGVHVKRVAILTKLVNLAKILPSSNELAKGPLWGSLNFIRLLRVVITPSITSLLRGENDSKQSDEFQATPLGAFLVN